MEEIKNTIFLKFEMTEKIKQLFSDATETEKYYKSRYKGIFGPLIPKKKGVHVSWGMVWDEVTNQFDSLPSSYSLTAEINWDTKELIIHPNGWIINKFNISKGRMFTLFILIISAYMIFMWALNSGGNAWVFFISGAWGGFIGASASFYKKANKRVHYIVSAALIIFSAIGIGMTYSEWVPFFISATIASPLLFGKKISNPMYWFKITAFIFLIYGLINI